MEMPLEQNIESDAVMKKIEIYIPKWVEMLSEDHEIKRELIEKTRKLMNKEGQPEEKDKSCFEELNYIENVLTEPFSGDKWKIHLSFAEHCYYEMLSSLTGVTIPGEYQLINLIRELSALKDEYMNVEQAIVSARNTGYGVVVPKQEEIRLEEPFLIRQGNKFGVKIKAFCPSVHLIKTEIETEISPIVGDEKQAQDLIAYIKESENSGNGIWETNIFGKSIEQLTQDGISMKLAQIGTESQQKLQKMLQRIVNETNGGFICVIL